jgi:FdhD protein
MATIRIGVSACLLGQNVRYDGGNKRDAFLTDVLGREVELVAVCPEVEMGLGTPREPMRLERQDGALRMITVDSRIDHSSKLQSWAERRLDELAAMDLCGYVLKADSPSCGLERVKVFEGPDPPELSGRGLFAAALTARFPDLPVVDERGLADDAVREDFMRRVLACSQYSLSPVRPVRVVRVTRNASASALDHAAVEEPLEIRLHGRPFVVIMRTPGADRELAAGFLLAEGVVTAAGELGAVEHCRHPDYADVHNVVNVFLTGAAAGRIDAILDERRNVLASSSCGLCGRVTIDSLKSRTRPLGVHSSIAPAIVRQLPGALRATQSIFDRTGGLHGAALFSVDGTLLTSAEDVGRHNAVDKVLGRIFLEERLPLPGHVLVVSGRTSFEIVQKAWIAGVEIVCAVSAPSSLAIELAREANINVYASAERVGAHRT